jgi:LysR family hydrogen peroxide-inducible transcriptional activator
MTMRHVRYFLTICEELNFTRAARLCGISQPTITTAIKRMERRIGGTLFLRSTRNPHVQMTALALRLYPILIQMNELLQEVAKISG